MVKSAIFEFLALDFFEPKLVKDIADYVKGKCHRSCSRMNVWVYLRNLERDRVIERIEESRKRVKYALVGYKNHQIVKSKFDERVKLDISKFQVDIEKMIKAVECGVLNENEVRGLLFSVLTRLELIKLEGAEMILKADSPLKSTSIFPSIIEYYFDYPSRWMLELMTAFGKRYPKAVFGALNILKGKVKIPILDDPKYKLALSKMSVDPKHWSTGKNP